MIEFASFLANSFVSPNPRAPAFDIADGVGSR